MDEPHVVALCGSLRDRSKTRVVLREALDAAGAEGASTELLDLREYDLPPYDPDAETAHAARELGTQVADADAVVLGTPNYHGSYTGALKDALDHLGRDEFEDATVGLVEVAGGTYPGSALEHLRRVSRTLNAWTLPLEVAVPRSAETVSDGEIVEDDVLSRVRRFGRELVDYAGVGRYPELRERASPPLNRAD